MNVFGTHLVESHYFCEGKSNDDLAHQGHNIMSIYLTISTRSAATPSIPSQEGHDRSDEAPVVPGLPQSHLSTAWGPRSHPRYSHCIIIHERSTKIQEIRINSNHPPRLKASNHTKIVEWAHYKWSVQSHRKVCHFIYYFRLQFQISQPC